MTKRRGGEALPFGRSKEIGKEISALEGKQKQRGRRRRAGADLRKRGKACGGKNGALNGQEEGECEKNTASPTTREPWLGGRKTRGSQKKIFQSADRRGKRKPKKGQPQEKRSSSIE